MTKMMTAIALAIALPEVANAQAAPAPAPAPKAEQGGKMMDCKCCKDMAAKGHHGTGTPAPKADHQQHQQ